VRIPSECKTRHETMLLEPRKQTQLESKQAKSVCIPSECKTRHETALLEPGDGRGWEQNRCAYPQNVRPGMRPRFLSQEMDVVKSKLEKCSMKFSLTTPSDAAKKARMREIN
jgi:hypothetical protein